MYLYFGYRIKFKDLILHSREYNFPITIKLVVSNNKDAQGILYAKKNSIPYLIINTSLRNFENKLLNILKFHKINLICLAGYMRIVSKNFLKKFGKKLLIFTLLCYPSLKV